MNFGIVVFPQVEELDFVGPWEMFTLWKQIAGGPQTCVIVAESTAPVVCANGLSVNPHVGFDECPPLDVLLVPGGEVTRAAVADPELLGFVARQAAGCRAVLSVCTGALVLHAAGLLSGHKATTHWSFLERLRARGDVEVVEERFTRDGKLWCAAGVSAGIDLALAYIADAAGEDAAGRVQHFAEYYPSRRRYGAYASGPGAPAYLRQA